MDHKWIETIMTTIIYGINNCDSVQKAKRWLVENQIDFSFHDFRKDGLEHKLVLRWVGKIQWDLLLNRRGTTWRGIDQKIKNDIDGATIVNFLCDHPTVIKRPVLEHGDLLLVGLNEIDYPQLFK